MPGKSRARLEYEASKNAPPVQRSNAVYSKLFDLKAHDYALLGASNAEIAELLDVNPSSVDAWMVEQPTFKRAVNRARVGANVRVVKSLYRAANGYRHRETKLNVIGGKLIKTDITKAYPPSVQAAAMVLTNRASKHWRDVKNVEHTGQISLAALVSSSFGEDAKAIEAQPVEPEEDC